MLRLLSTNTRKLFTLMSLLFISALFFIPEVKAIEPVYDTVPFAEDYEDTVYPAKYGKKTPPHKGTEFGYITIPSIKLKQTVYDGDIDTQIYNLRMWHWVTGRSGYKMLETQMSVYFHNYDSYTTTSNGVRHMNIGEYFTFTTKDTVYLYTVEDMFGEWREVVLTDYVQPFLDQPDTIYLITCGRNELRYKDLVVVGKMKAHYTLEEWETEKNNIIYDENFIFEQKIPQEDIDLIDTHIVIENTDNKYSISVRDSEDNIVPDCKLGLFDKDGLVAVENDERMVFFQNNEPWTFETELKGCYAVGAIEVPGGYKIPEDRELNITLDGDVIEKEIGNDSVINEKEVDFINMMISISVGVCIFVILVTTIILIKRK